MRALDKARLRARSMFRRRAMENELDAELRFHLEQLTEDNIAKGMSPAEAGRLARRQMGSIAAFQEECRDMRRLNLIDHIRTDLPYGMRVLRRSPGFTAVAVFTLALGIGANTAIFSVVKAVLLEPLAYKQPGRILAIQTLWLKTNHAGNVSGGDYPDLVAEPSPFAAASRYAGGKLPVESGGQAEFVAAYGTDAGFSDVFQLKPVAGRLITPDEFRKKANVAVVSEGFALRHFGAANRALGQILHVEENAIAIVGVLPADFHFPLSAELWFPVPWENTNRTAGNYRAIALLKPGVTPAAARAFLSAVGARLQRAFPEPIKRSRLPQPRSWTCLWNAAAPRFGC